MSPASFNSVMDNGYVDIDNLVADIELAESLMLDEIDLEDDNDI